MTVKHFLSITDLSRKELNDVLFLSARVKSNPKKFRTSLDGKVLGLLFNKPSTRTRVSFEAGIYQLGGNSVFLTEKDIQIGRGESVADTAKVLSGYLDGIVIRTYDHENLVEFSKNSTIPVINGLSDLLHPCQILSDIFTIIENKGHIDGINIAYIGDGANNMAHTWILAAEIFGFNLRIAAPEKYQPHSSILDKAKGAHIEITTDTEKAAEGADILYTDVWVSMGQDSEREERVQEFKNYQINSDLFNKAAPCALLMHCLPAHMGEEVTSEVFYGPQSIVFQQAENRLHVQKTLMLKLLN
jgi:ornithine carbamoyltransferase